MSWVFNVCVFVWLICCFFWSITGTLDLEGIEPNERHARRWVS
jgi:hypothetical protein